MLFSKKTDDKTKEMLDRVEKLERDLKYLTEDIDRVRKDKKDLEVKIDKWFEQQVQLVEELKNRIEKKINRVNQEEEMKEAWRMKQLKRVYGNPKSINSANSTELHGEKTQK